MKILYLPCPRCVSKWNTSCDGADVNGAAAPKMEALMLLNLYKALWIIAAVATMLFVVTGNLGAMALVVLGFLLFGLVFMGMISILPTMVSHAHEEAAAVIPQASFAENAKERVSAVQATWSPDVDVANVQFH